MTMNNFVWLLCVAVITLYSTLVVADQQDNNQNQSSALVQWKNLFLRSYYDHNVDLFQREYEKLNTERNIEWDRNSPLIYHVIEQDAASAWYWYLMQKKQSSSSDQLLSIDSVFGHSCFSRLANEQDQQCIANLYHNSKQSNASVCHHDNYQTFDTFLNCWSYDIRKTEMGQYLIWRMLKTIQHCYGVVRQDMTHLRSLERKILAHDQNETGRIIDESKQLDTSDNDWPLTRARMVMSDRQRQYNELISYGMSQTDEFVQNREASLSYKLRKAFNHQ